MMGALLGKNVTHISAGEMHIVAVSSDGMVFAWGNNDFNQLGSLQVNMNGVLTRFYGDVYVLFL